MKARPTNHRPYRQRPRGWSAMSGAEGSISEPRAAGTKLRIGPRSAPVHPTRARSGPPGFIDQDAGRRNGFPNRGAFPNTGPSLYEAVMLDLAFGRGALQLDANGPRRAYRLNNPSDPTNAGDDDEGGRLARGLSRARGRAGEPSRLCKSGRRALQGQGSGGLRPLLQPPRGHPGGPRGRCLQGGRAGGTAVPVPPPPRAGRSAPSSASCRR